ncbi:MAG: endonuclease V [Candidatus Sumerlaeota bacterium]|nr:endonuclease V [Candidatus Sumerlaeota bacterium]
MAAQIQMRLRDKVIYGATADLRTAQDLARIETVAGLDVSYSKETDRCYAAVVIMRLSDLSILQEIAVGTPSPFPYVPGLLSFREAPPLIAALRRLRKAPDVLLFDAQGRAHPRRFGLASHLSVLYDRAGVGCAKTLLCGVYKTPGLRRGDWTPLVDEKSGETLGSVLRTQDRVKPVFVSVGHRADNAFARSLVLHTSPHYRLPEPIRRAHWLSNDLRLRSESQ